MWPSTRSVVGGVKIAETPRREAGELEPARVKDTWRGRLALTRAQLASSSIEVSNSSQGSARLRGMFVPERFAAEEAVRPLDGPERDRARAALQDLVAATTPDAQVDALFSLSELGPAVIPFLEAVAVDGPQAGARQLALERFGAGP